MSKNSKVLALKYRPQVFEDLIGQNVVAETIYNSIELGKTPNAYLFTGIRGVGKTTIARIVAKALNCKNGLKNLCKQDFCETCDSIMNSNHLDVLEMDAASKTGVDDVRDLIEFSRYGPTSAKYKIFIIDEVHMLSKQAFNALLKTLEEPPEYLKFIFATTEIKKIPVTVVSRCQRFDLSRVKSNDLFEFLKKINNLEKGSVSDDALKLIVKISEGSVRDALSLLDRALISQPDKDIIDLSQAQKIFGYFDKSSLINLFESLFKGDEKKVIEIYKSIYESGIEPKVFLNDFLELLYYFKNISSIKSDGNNFSLNDDEFKKISNLSETVEQDSLMLFWHFTIKTLDELNIVSNQNISIEMFLLRLLYLKGLKKVKVESEKNEIIMDEASIKEKKIDFNDDEKLNPIKNTISQIKNITQEEKQKPENKINEIKGYISIKNFKDLLKICNEKKEIKLKYELETNVNLVGFEEERIEISFNENLDKSFVKDLSSKLFEWTNKRWIISFSKKKGALSSKELIKKEKERLIDNVKKGDIYQKTIKLFPDAELVDVQINDEND